MSQQSINPPIKSNQSNPACSKGEIQENQKAQGRWEEDQHIRFLIGVMQYGKDWKLVQKVVKTRTGTQVRSHAQKYFLKFRRQQKDKKKNKNKQFLGPTQLEQEIIRSFTQSDITAFTPPQLVSVLQLNSTVNKESHYFNINPQNVRLNDNNIKKHNDKEKDTKKIFDPQKFSLNKGQKNMYEKTNLLFRGICKENIQIIHEDDSFFISTLKKNIDLFKRVQNIIDLTDIKKQHQIPIFTIPKTSFSLIAQEKQNNLGNANINNQQKQEQEKERHSKKKIQEI